MIDIIYIPWIFVVASLHICCVKYTKYRAEKYLRYPYEPLPDILQEILPTMDFGLPDKLLFISFLYMIGDVSLRDKYTVINEEIVPLLCMLSIRPFFCCLTTLPACIPKNDGSSFYNDIFVSSHDLMFSGHTCSFIFLGKIINGSIGTFIGYILPLSLITSKVHYSIDVFVSMIIYNYIVLLINN